MTTLRNSEIQDGDRIQDGRFDDVIWRHNQHICFILCERHVQAFLSCIPDSFVAFHSVHFQSLKGFRWGQFGPQYEIGRQVYIIEWNVKETIEIEAAYT